MIPDIDLIYLSKQPQCINTVKNPFVSFLKNYKDSNTYNISLPKTWKEYTMQILKKNFHIQNLRKKKLLKKIGIVRFKIVTNENEKNKYIEELIKQKNARLSSQGIKDIFKLEDLNFYKNFERLEYFGAVQNSEPSKLQWSLHELFFPVHPNSEKGHQIQDKIDV